MLNNSLVGQEENAGGLAGHNIGASEPSYLIGQKKKFILITEKIHNYLLYRNVRQLLLVLINHNLSFLPGTNGFGGLFVFQKIEVV